MRLAFLTLFALAACAAQSSSRNEGWERIDMNDYSGAAALFSRDLEHGDSADAQAGLARALFLLGRLHEADAAYAKAIQLEPTAQSHLGRSLVQMALGDTESAIRSCDRALEIDPTLAKAWYDRGLAHSAADREREALADFSHAVEIDAQFAEAYNARGLVLVGLERMDEAAQDFRAASQLDPLFAAARANCAVASYARGEVGLALMDLDAAIKIDRRQPLFYANRGRILLDQGDPERAATDFEQAMALGDASVWPLLSQARERNGRTDETHRDDAHEPKFDPTLASKTSTPANPSQDH